MQSGAQALEDDLTELNKERAGLEHEITKSLASTVSHSLVERTRRHRAEKRLQDVVHGINRIRQELRALGRP